LRFQIANQQLQIPFLSGDLVEEDVLAGINNLEPTPVTHGTRDRILPGFLDEDRVPSFNALLNKVAIQGNTESVTHSLTSVA
jgi:hypothetical protein